MVDIVRELNKRLKGSWVGVKTEKATLPFMVMGFEHTDNGELGIILRDTRKRTTTLKFDENLLVLDCPQLGMVFDGEKTAYIRRIPNRQWKRGYNGDIISVNYLEADGFHHIGLSAKSYEAAAILNFIFNPNYYPFNEAIKLIENGDKFSLPISRKFAISCKMDSQYPVVYYKEWLIGWVEKGVIQLPTTSHHLYEELSQYAQCKKVETV